MFMLTKTIKNYFLPLTGNVKKYVVLWLIKSDDVHFSLFVLLGRPDAAQGGSDSLVEGDKVGGVQGGVTHAVLGVLHCAQPLALAEAEQDVIAEYQEDFHRRHSPASQQAAGRSLR